MESKIIRIIIVLLGVLMLSGTSCSFRASSGSSSREGDEEQSSNLVVIIRSGQLIDGPVQGVRYVSGSVTGITGSEGEFQYEAGNSVGFFIGDIALGEVSEGKAVITPLDLVPGGTLDTPAVINIARLLQSLDSVPGDDKITIPARVRAAAVQTNETVSPSILYLDFSDETVFTNTASQLIATLTDAYPFTAVLVDGESARRHLRRSLDLINTQ